MELVAGILAFAVIWYITAFTDEGGRAGGTL